MGKIVKLKNKKTGERVYPVTATKAVVDADSGERLNDTLQNKVEEAPMDGNQYVRSGGVWKVAELASPGIEICNISLVSNQGESDASSLYGATVKVTDVDSTEVYYNGVWDGTEISLEFAPGVNYKVEVGAVADYATPEPKTLTAFEQNVRNAVMTYQTEVVSVTLSSDNGVSVVGQIVTINGVQHTWNGTAISQKVAFGTSYSVSVDAKEGYLLPSVQTFVASQVKRDVSIVYYQMPGTLNPSPGIYIQDVNGYCYTTEEWEKASGITPNGILVKTDTIQFVIALRNATSADTIWSSTLTLIDGITTTEDFEDVIEDFDGEEQTIKIRSQLGLNEAVAADACYDFIFPNGKHGYMGAAGEWDIAHTNKDKIEEALSACGGDSLEPDGWGFYWTSTQYDERSVWVAYWHSNPQYGIVVDPGEGIKNDYEFSNRAFTSV